MSDSKLEQRYPDDKWDGLADYLSKMHSIHHNQDYLEFLVSKIWKLDHPCRVVDFGCGSGRFGRILMPLLPAGSTYTGIDQSGTLIEEGRKLFADMPYNAEFFQADAHKVPFADESFDLATSYGVLMHVPDAMGALNEMIRVTRHGGMVITCEANRLAHAAMFHIDELDTQDTVALELFQTINREIRRRTDVDHNIGIKMPVIMHKAGLKDVQARVSDCVRLVFPPIDAAYKEAVFQAICEQGYGSPKPNDEEREKWKARLINYGISEEDAEKQIEKEVSLDFGTQGREYHTVYPGLMSFSFGRVEKD